MKKLWGLGMMILDESDNIMIYDQDTETFKSVTDVEMNEFFIQVNIKSLDKPEGE